MTNSIDGYCPACGGSTLFREGASICCSRSDCPEPDAVSTLLQDRELQHIVVLEPDSFTIRHPLIERLHDQLMQCGLANYITALEGPPRVPGRYRVSWVGVTPLWRWEPIRGVRDV